jgi:hypothetical protein
MTQTAVLEFVELFGCHAGPNGYVCRSATPDSFRNVSKPLCF